MNRVASIMLFVFTCVASAKSDVCLWSGTPGNVSIVGANVEILAAGPYKLEAVTTCGSSTTLADIGAITINRDYAATAIVCDDARRALSCASGSRPAPSL